MAMKDRREQLKKEYKEHYRSIREAKERLSRSRKTNNIARALNEMDKSQMLESFDNMLLSLHQKLAAVESRLDAAIGSLNAEAFESSQEQDLDEEMRKVKAKETLRQIKREMGTLYQEIEQQAESMNINKTIGRKPSEKESSEE
jgi:hypothetical protein